jgi:hypothetical protein
MKENVIICKIDITTDVEKVFSEKTLRNDKVLTDSILEFSKKIEFDDGEIFKHEKNIIATSEGYFLAFYESEVEPV